MGEPRRPVQADTVLTLSNSVRAGDRTATQVLEECRKRVEVANGLLNAFVHVDWEAAESSAEQIDQLIALGRDPGNLAGVPFGVKDLQDCAGMPTTMGSLLFKGSEPKARDSVIVSRLRAAGAVPIGKTAA